jgi:hypothetical protein
MNWIRKHRPSPATAIAFAALVVALGGAAFAAIPDSNGTIHGCYDRLGRLRVVDTETNPPQVCGPKDHAIAWSQRGPKGDAGATGPTGPTGPSGGGGGNVSSATLRLSATGDTDQRNTLLTRDSLTFTVRCLRATPTAITADLFVRSDNGPLQVFGGEIPEGREVSLEEVGGHSSPEFAQNTYGLFAPNIGQLTVTDGLGVDIYGSDCIAGIVVTG